MLFTTVVIHASARCHIGTVVCDAYCVVRFLLFATALTLALTPPLVFGNRAARRSVLACGSISEPSSELHRLLHYLTSKNKLRINLLLSDSR